MLGKGFELPVLQYWFIRLNNMDPIRIQIAEALAPAVVCSPGNGLKEHYYWL